LYMRGVRVRLREIPVNWRVWNWEIRARADFAVVVHSIPLRLLI
jgi:hypothetical protein